MQYNLKRGSTQWRFHQSRAKIQIFAGAFANGKSTAMIIKTLNLARDYPGMNAVLGRASYPKLKGTLQRDFMRWCPPSWVKKRPTQDDNTCYLQNGSAIQFRYIAQKGKNQEDGSSTSNLLSATYDLVAIDQIEDPEIEYKDFLDLLGRLRGDTPYKPVDADDETMPSSGPRWMLIGANPSRNWFYKQVIAPYVLWRDKHIYSEKLIVDAETKKPLIDLFEDSTYSNRANLADDYIQTLEAAYKGQMRERYLLGKWAAFEGLVYPTFDPSRNLITRAEALNYLDNCLQRHVQIFALEGYDFGLVSPSCYLLAFVDDAGRVFIIDGFYKSECSYEDHPGMIQDIRDKYIGRLSIDEPIEADPAIFRRQIVAKRDTGDTLAKLLKDLGLRLRPANNEILSGIAKVGTYLGGKLGIPHIVTGADPGPLLYIVDDLTFFTDEIQSYYWKKNTLGQHIDEPAGDMDHAMDTTKYLLSRRPEVAQIVLPRDKLPPQWAFWHEMEMNDFQRVQKQRR